MEKARNDMRESERGMKLTGEEMGKEEDEGKEEEETASFAAKSHASSSIDGVP